MGWNSFRQPKRLLPPRPFASAQGDMLAAANYRERNGNRHCQSDEEFPVAVEDDGSDQADEQSAERAADGDH